MKRSLRLAVLAAAVVVGSGFMGKGYAEDPTAPPAMDKVEARTIEDVQKDLKAVGQELHEKIGPVSVLFDATKRDELAPVAIPLMKKMGALFTELGMIEPKYAVGAAAQVNSIKPMLVMLGDKDTIAALTEAAKGDGKPAVAAKLSLAVGGWYKASKDADAQGKILTDLEALAKADPANDSIAMALVTVSGSSAANEDLSTKAKDIVSTMTGKFAKQVASQLEGEKKLEANVGKPLVIAGTTPAGDKFSTADMKGKVILVDFWASWCGPCKAELPRVIKTYKELHEKGFEVVGVDNDYSADALASYLKDNPDLVWPQVIDMDAVGQHQWNKITTGFGINGIPVMFLIDKKGVLRSVTAREDFEKQIPKLLAE